MRRYFNSLDRGIATAYDWLLDRVGHERSIAALLSHRYADSLAARPRSERSRFLRDQPQALLRREIEDRAEQLLETWLLESIWKRRRTRGPPGREWRRRWGYPPTPHLEMFGVNGARGLLHFTMPLPQMLKEVRTFVQRHRAGAGIVVRRGKERVAAQAPEGVLRAYVLHHLLESHRKTKADLLRLCGRDATPHDYRWLDRRLAWAKSSPDDYGLALGFLLTLRRPELEAMLKT